jgi:hypothetical protein
VQGVPADVRADVDERRAARDESPQHLEILALVAAEVERHDRRDAAVARVAGELYAPEAALEHDVPLVDPDRGDIRPGEQVTVFGQHGVQLAHAARVGVFLERASLVVCPEKGPFRHR